MLERLKWSVLALAQPADIQVKLYPDFVLVADELALDWESALEIEVKPGHAAINFYQRGKIEVLDSLLDAISGPGNSQFWDDNALRQFPEWDQIRMAAADIARSFHWPILPPPPSGDIFIKGPARED